MLQSVTLSTFDRFNPGSCATTRTSISLLGAREERPTTVALWDLVISPVLMFSALNLDFHCIIPQFHLWKQKDVFARILPLNLGPLHKTSCWIIINLRFLFLFLCCRRYQRLHTGRNLCEDLKGRASVCVLPSSCLFDAQSFAHLKPH